MNGALMALVLLLGFDPGASQRALAHPDGREAALRQVFDLARADRTAARAAGLGLVTAALAADPGVDLGHRVLAARATALLGDRRAVTLLTNALDLAERPDAVALAREVAVALRQLGAVEALVPALSSADPEVRATAAGAGAGGALLCALLTDDPWPDVRAAAARGLAKHPDAATCLEPALKDPSAKVVTAAARSAGEVGQPALAAPLRVVAGDARAPMPGRVEAFVALARLGDVEPARKALMTHLAKGGIVPLAEAAVHALHHGGEAALPLVRGALKSASPRVQMAAVRVLAGVGDRESVDAIRALREDARLSHRSAIDDALRRLAPVQNLGDPVGEELD